MGYRQLIFVIAMVLVPVTIHIPFDFKMTQNTPGGEIHRGYAMNGYSETADSKYIIAPGLAFFTLTHYAVNSKNINQ